MGISIPYDFAMSLSANENLGADALIAPDYITYETVL